MGEENKSIDELIGQSEKIGTIGSPSSTAELTLDIMGTAVQKKLVGELALFTFKQENVTNYALGQITEIMLRNTWLEDPTMRSLARQRGVVNPVSGQQDTHLGQMTISAVFKENGDEFDPSILGTVPPTGTYIHLVSDEIIDKLLKKYREEIFYLGHVYGSLPKLPMWFKHFATGPKGAGEAYHIGIFGKTGSGKSVLAKMIMLAYARHSHMAIFVIDPQGEFSKDIRGEFYGNFPLDLKGALDALGKEIVLKSIKDLILDRWELFSEILYESNFFERLSIPKGENRRIACDILADKLKAKTNLDSLNSKEAFNKAWDILGEEKVQTVIYKSDTARKRFIAMYEESDRDEFYRDHWIPVAKFFSKDREGSISVDELILQTLELSVGKRPVVIIDLSKEQAEGILWSEMIQSLIIKRLFDGLINFAERGYKENLSLNTLVILDEAHRLAPRENPDDEKKESVRAKLIDAVRTTRKYGLGWMFISQTLSSLHKEIVEQLRIMFFGFGLALGTEFQALRELVGGDQNALKLYQSFRDPHSSFNEYNREYTFMTIGPISPLSFSGTPLFFTAFNNPEEFLRANRIEINKS